MVAPVTKPTEHSGGSRSMSSSQRAATFSAIAADGAQPYGPAFCPQALVSMSAATPTGCEAPITQPKNRGPVEAVRPGSAASTRASITADASEPVSGVGPSNSASSSAAVATGRGGRSARVSRKRLACWAACSNSGR